MEQDDFVLVDPMAQSFVQISADGSHFEIAGHPWYFAGCNW